MTEYVYDEKYIRSTIEGVLAGYEESEYAELTNSAYARIFQSGMTNISIAIISKNRSDVENILDEEFMYWLDPESFYDEDDEFLDTLSNTIDISDTSTFNGLTVVDDEAGPLQYYKRAVVFSESIQSIIENYDVDTVDEVLSYADEIVDDFYFIMEDEYNPEFDRCRLDVVDYSYFRF